MNDQRSIRLGLLASLAAMIMAATPAAAQKKPNVVMLMSDELQVGATTVFTTAARPWGIPRRTSTALPRKARFSPVGTVRQAARRAVLPS